MYRIGPGGVELVGGSNRDASSESVRQALVEHGPATYAELEDITGQPRTTVRRILDQLVESGDARDLGKRGRERLFGP